MHVSQSAFLQVAKMIRTLPKVRGKVRFGQVCFNLATKKPSASFIIEAPLFPDRLTFQLNLDCAHERMAYLMGQYEEETISLLTSLWAGGSFLDVGANVGLISVPFASRIAKTTRITTKLVYAFEALSTNYKALCTNIELNNLGHLIVPINMGLGAEDKEVQIHVEGDNFQRTGTANILPDAFEGVRTTIEIRSIDTLMSKSLLPANISLIKIDTDGYDYEVLKGARELLRNNRPIVYAELAEHCLNWHGYGIAEVAGFLDDLDYEVWPLKDSTSMRFRKDLASDYVMNSLLIPKESANELAVNLL